MSTLPFYRESNLAIIHEQQKEATLYSFHISWMFGFQKKTEIEANLLFCSKLNALPKLKQKLESFFLESVR